MEICQDDEEVDIDSEEEVKHRCKCKKAAKVGLPPRKALKKLIFKELDS
jgi:hypothetical protein